MEEKERIRTVTTTTIHRYELDDCLRREVKRERDRDPEQRDAASSSHMVYLLRICERGGSHTLKKQL